MSDTDWTIEKIAELRRLWDAVPKISIRIIAERLGISKNAVVGKAHRLHLTPRPSPILPKGSETSKRRRVRVQKQTLAPLDSIPVPIANGKAPDTPAQESALNSPLTVIPKPLEPKIIADPIFQITTDRRRPCCWPIGHPGSRQFRFCESPSQTGHVYCPEHVAIAYVRVVPKKAKENDYIRNL
jgi:GcrA cell cycle regulator